MATGHHLLLVELADVITVQTAIRDALNDQTFIFTRQARALGTLGPTTHWYCSQYLSDAQLAYLDSIKVNYTSFDYVTYMIPPSRTQDPTPAAWLESKGLEEVP